MERIQGMLFLAGAFSLAGTSVVTARYFSGNLGLFTITAVSLFLALFILLPLAWKELARGGRRLPGRDWALLFLQALFGIVLFRFFLLSGLELTSSAEAGILTGATPAVTVVLARLLLRESADRLALLGIASTIAGMGLLQMVSSTGAIGSFAPEHLAGNALVCCAASSESLFNVLSRKFAAAGGTPQRDKLHPMAQTALVTAIAFALSAVPALFERPAAVLPHLAWSEWLALVWYGSVVTALAFILWYADIQRCRVSTAAAFSGLMPFTSLLLSVTLLGERSFWLQWAGGVLVILGIVLIAVRQQPQSKPAAKRKDAEPS